MNTKSIGDWGEDWAAKHLQGHGYRIVALRYRTRHGEIDIIAADLEYIIFIEVKTRRDNRFSEAREAVSPRKIEKIKQTAALWLAENETELQPRFDVIELYAPLGEQTANPTIRHWEDAF